MKGCQLNNAVAQLQENNNGTLAGLSYDDFVNALGDPTNFSLHESYWTKNGELRWGWVCSWGGEKYSASYYIEVVFDRITKKFYHLANETWDKTKDDWYIQTTNKTSQDQVNNNTNSSNCLGIIGVFLFLTFFIMYMILG